MWQPITEHELRVLISEAEGRMEPAVEAFWNEIKIRPQKWQLPPWGDEGDGFWVVAIVGEKCVYYNDIEEGFNSSPFDELGVIGEYWCNQSELDIEIRSFRIDFLIDIRVESNRNP